VIHRRGFVVTCVAVLLAPLAGRLSLARWGPPAAAITPSYLPALEATRERTEPFDNAPIVYLRDDKPRFVTIGDSMATRVYAPELRRLGGGPATVLLENATGSAHWYLAFKNHVVRSGVTPDWVLIFFRDTNLTDPLFRIAGEYRAKLDNVALDYEAELNAVVAERTRGAWFRLHAALDGAYHTEQTQAWLEPALPNRAAETVAGRGGRDAFLARVNDLFTLDKLRPMEAADMAAADAADLDFSRVVGPSTLPLILDLARSHSLHVCFIRVLRRPENGRPPVESPALGRYVAALRQYIGAHGGAMLDDRDDPALARLAYDDGDHIMMEERMPYTARLVQRLAQLPR